MPGDVFRPYRSAEAYETYLRGVISREPGPGRDPDPTGRAVAAARATYTLGPLAGVYSLFAGPRGREAGPELVGSFDEATGLARLELPRLESDSIAARGGFFSVEEVRSKINAELTALANIAASTGKIPDTRYRDALPNLAQFAQLGPRSAPSPIIEVTETSSGGPIAPYRRDFVGYVIPTGANAGWAQQTPAVKALLARLGGSRSRSGKRRKRAKKARKASRSRSSKKARKSSSGRPAKRASRSAKFVKGSVAAKRHMARLRNMRKK